MADEPLVCRSYTHARRFPLVIGKIGGYALPSPWTPTQLLVGLTAALALLATRSAWAHLPGALNLVVLAGVPCTAGWAVRHLRVEGRTPLRAAVGLVAVAAAPQGGRLGGRAWRQPGPRRLSGALFVTATPPLLRRER